ncbi:MAG: molybdate ABC transporter substrate-binding protein [Acidobacteria bacterium]|nr:molybdate ABC transporter substrate-binding protein [Acidobacteriota bacterium]
MFERRAVLAGLLGLFAACAGSGGGDGDTSRVGDAAPVLVSAAASLSEVMAVIADRFEGATGSAIRLNVAGSQMLASQIIEGAPVDLFVSADELQMERVAEAGRIDAGSRIDLLANQLVVVVPSDRPGTVAAPRDLARASIERLALGDPAAVPAGVYARDWLRATGLWGAVATKVVPASNVRAALRAVESGAADAGIVYRTDVRTATGAIVAFEVPIGDGPAIVYPAAVATGAPNRSGAVRFLDYLQTSAVRPLFEAAGFVTLR